MTVLPKWLNEKVFKKAQEEEESYLREKQKIKEKAQRYEQLINCIGYIEFIDIIVSKINAEISEATTCPLEPERQRIHVIRWNAMREVMDAAVGDIEITIKERNRINEEERVFMMQPSEKGEQYGS